MASNKLLVSGFSEFCSVLLLYGFTQANTDHSLLILHRNQATVSILVYVEDILVTGSDVSLNYKVKTHLALHFKIKDLGALKYFVGIEAARSTKGI